MIRQHLNFVPTKRCRDLFAFLCLFVLTVSPWHRSHADDGGEFFEKKIRPLLISKCADCHTGTTPEGDLRLDGREHLLRGGMNGVAVVVGDPDASTLIQRIESTAEGVQMPPEESLSAAEIADLRRWIADGAQWPAGSEEWNTAATSEQHWAFQPLSDSRPPEPANADWCLTTIDQFVAAGHESKGVQPVAAADRRTWIRRATLDLTGLPPQIPDVEHFVADPDPDAVLKVINRLLDSPAYGERWGRYWLDQARYADTSGDGTDTPIPEARYYRNYVIDSFNEDLPYNTFLIEQIAGDILADQQPDHPRVNQRIVATGYIALSRRFGNSAFAEMNLIIDDTIDTIGKSVLGLTLGCARCHHHKFDPVSLEDYYGLYGYFENTQYPHAGTEHQKERAHFVPLQKRDDWPEDYESLEAWAVSDKDELSGDAAIRIGGDLRQKGEVVPRAFLSALTEQAAQIPAGTSGRLQFAKWLASDDNALTARVIANRVWQYHFGTGLVPTSSNFGIQGAKPSHPELLDWLARDLIEHGWSLKHLHRRIMSSAVYRLSSEDDPDNLARDEANHSLWKYNRRRMDAEALRDSLLAVSHLLQEGDSGRHPFKPTAELKYSQGRPFDQIFDHRYRSVYLMSPRLKKHPFMALFDGPDPNKTTDNRRVSTVALQALFMMNSEFIRDTSTAFADRLMTYSSDVDQRLIYAWQVALGRNPTSGELADAEHYLQQYAAELKSAGTAQDESEMLAWASFSRALLSSNEFLFIE
jgi:hypothetical protein